MMAALRLALHGASFAVTVLLLAPTSMNWAMALEAGILVALLLVAVGRLRPWSDGVAWSGTMGILALLPQPALAVPAIVGLGLACVGFIGALHRPPTGVPAVRTIRSFGVWALAAAIAFVLTWMPSILAQGRAAALQDPLSAAGAAIRIFAAVLVLIGAITVLAIRARLRWKRTRKQIARGLDGQMPVRIEG